MTTTLKIKCEECKEEYEVKISMPRYKTSRHNYVKICCITCEFLNTVYFED